MMKKSRKILMFISAILMIAMMAACTPTPKQFTISFEANGGAGVPTAITQDVGSAVTKPAQDPTKEGYSFGGWFADITLSGDAYAFSVMPENNLTLYAKWNINKYTITFNANGGTDVTKIEQNYNTDVTEPEEPTKENYVFGGWYVATDLSGSAYTFNKMPSSNLTLNAKWTGKTYSMQFESNGGSAVATISQAYGSALTAPAAPTKVGYSFGGWYTEEALTTAYTMPSTMPTNIKLYAKWLAADSKLHFNSKGGSAVADIDAKSDTNVTLPTAPTKAGCIFDAWYTDAALTTKFNNVMPAGENTVYAKWLTVEQGTKVNLNSWVFGKEYTVDTAVDGTVTVTTNKSHSAWSYIGHAIPFNVKAYSRVIIKYSVEGDAALQCLVKVQDGGVTAKETGYVQFSGANQTYEWTLGERNLTNGAAPMQFIIFVHAGTDGAHASKLKLHSVELCIIKDEGAAQNEAIFFDTGAYGSGVNAILAAKEAAITAPADPTKPGYVFAGWTSDSANEVPYTFNKMPQGPTTLYAKWTANETKTITFNVDGGSAIEALSLPFGSNVVAPTTPTKSGFRFVNWYTDNTLSTIYTFTTMPTSDITVYAKWKANATNTLIFDAVGGTSTAQELTLSVGSSIENALPTATKAGYVFKGWYEDANYATKFNATTMPDMARTLYAKWESETDYTVTFNTNGGSAVAAINVKGLTNATIPAAPSKDNVIFHGWFLDQAFTTPWTGAVKEENLTVYAKWVVADTNYRYSILSEGTWKKGQAGHSDPVVNPETKSVTYTGTTVATEQWVPSYMEIGGNLKGYAAVEFTFQGTAGVKVKFKVEGGGVTQFEFAELTLDGTVQKAYTTLNQANLTSGAKMKFCFFFNFSYNTVLGTDKQIEILGLDLFIAKLPEQGAMNAIKFDSDGGSAVNTIYAEIGSSVVLPTPTKAGYTFTGWVDAANAQFSYAYTTMQSTVYTLKATWRENAKATLTFETNGGTEVAAMQATIGALVALPQAPTKKDVVFGAWYLDSAFTQMFDGYMPSANTKLYARYKVMDESKKINLLDYTWSVNPVTSYNFTQNDTTGHITIGVNASKSGYDHIIAPVSGNLKDQGYLTLVMKYTTTHVAHNFMIKVEGEGVTAAEWKVTIDPSLSGTLVWNLAAANFSTTLTKFVIFPLPGADGIADMTMTVTEYALYSYSFAA